MLIAFLTAFAVPLWRRQARSARALLQFILALAGRALLVWLAYRTPVRVRAQAS
jgi:hypothetical protein